MSRGNTWQIAERNALVLRQDAQQRHAEWVREAERTDRFAALVVTLLTAAYVVVEVLR